VANAEVLPIGNAPEISPAAVPIQNQTLPSDLHITKNHKTKLLQLFQNTTSENKKVTAAILTLTLGMLGVHRIYLGTAPYIPAVYLFTFGGGFFILPLIDLVMIITTNDISKFENNNKLLMWTGE
jgi:TM2 domain-containing membrane protein YozV